MEEKFFYCDTCGNLAVMLLYSGVTPQCCGGDMTELAAQSTDAGREKHVPVIKSLTENEITISVGCYPHPMTANHYIQFVCLQTTNGVIMRRLSPNDSTDITLMFTGKPLAIYVYCNVHGLWCLGIKENCKI